MVDEQELSLISRSSGSWSYLAPTRSRKDHHAARKPCALNRPAVTSRLAVVRANSAPPTGLAHSGAWPPGQVRSLMSSRDVECAVFQARTVPSAESMALVSRRPDDGSGCAQVTSSMVSEKVHG